jgi:chromosome segregation ATPase
VRDELDRARVKLSESDARAAAAEQRLEEVAAASRQRQTALDDALERQRLAESELARARRDASRFEAEARASVVDARSIDEQRQALAARDERIARLEGEKQDLVWRLAELEDKLRQAIARAVQGGVARPEAQAAAPLPAPTGQSAGEDPEAVRRARERALEDFHRASAAHVEEITELRAAVSEQMALVAELEDAVTAAEQRAASASSDAAVLRKTAKDFEEADRSRRTRLAELEGKLLRLEHERKVATASPGVSPEAERRLADLERERNDLRARIGELEASRAAAAQQNGQAGRSENGSAPRGSEVEAGRLENTLGNYRQRAGRLRDGLEGIRRRLESLSPAELSGFLEELGEDLAELG